VTSGINERPYLSIGEVLALLLEEFPDVTISKIRFLESQGLIEPERTSSGYRKFFDADIERLRVIRDRLETGEIDDSGAMLVPAEVPVAASAPVVDPAEAGNVSPLHRGIRNVRLNNGGPVDETVDDDTDGVAFDDPTGSVHPDAARVVTNRHPAAQARPLAAVQNDSPDPTPTGMLLRDNAPLEVLTRADLCRESGCTSAQLDALESYGLVTPRGAGSSARYTSADLAIVRAAIGFLERGIDARHLRGWRQSAEREVGLFEQRILPLLRQRNPKARHDAVQLMTELADLGEELRRALVVAMLRHHLDA
jgi:DNA-binding transcriptional MerR regulator